MGIFICLCFNNYHKSWIIQAKYGRNPYSIQKIKNLRKQEFNAAYTSAYTDDL